MSSLVTTPHLQGSLTDRPDRIAAFFAELDQAWSDLRAMAAAEFPALRVERGLEVMLDTPTPNLTDPRVRLAGTSFVLVEFPFMAVPPNSVQVIFDIKMRGLTPVIAHPERYTGVDEALRVVEEWRRVGGVLQVNSGSLLGRYGTEAKSTAWRLLRRGWVSYIASDYHARGQCSIRDARAKLEEHGAAEQGRLLMEVNPARLLDDALPVDVPPVVPGSRSIWSRVWRLLRRSA